MSILSFEWKGINSDNHGIVVKSLPAVYTAASREKTYTIPGRDGGLHVPDGSMEALTLLVDCYLPYEQDDGVSRLDTIRRWLTGSGWFTQSDLPGFAYKARIHEGIAFQTVLPGFMDRTFSITLYAEPYKYHWPEAAAIVLNTAGFIMNPGTAAAQPLLTVQGAGNLTLMFGEDSLTIDGLNGTLYIDCEAKLAYDGNGNLKTGIVSLAQEQWPNLAPGQNEVNWAGNVTRLSIVPRWRDL